MICSENLIPLVFSRPEIWDQTHMNYTSKKLKLKAWIAIAEKLNVPIDVAKARWTNLRDLFRRELKKTLKMAEETGDPNAHKPRWKHFKTMLFLKDQIIKDEGSSSVHIEDSFSIYPQTILGDESDLGFRYEDDGVVEIESSLGSVSSQQEAVPPSGHSRKRTHDEVSQYQSYHPGKRLRWDAQSSHNGHIGNGDDSRSQPVTDVDEDYHFVMSILPSIRRIRLERKTSFKMKVLQLIVDEEKLDAS